MIAYLKMDDSRREKHVVREAKLPQRKIDVLAIRRNAVASQRRTSRLPTELTDLNVCLDRTLE